MEYLINGAAPRTKACDLPISKEEFERYRNAKVRFVRLLQIEEKFAMLLENYVELEQDLVGLAVRSTVFTDFEWDAGISRLYQVSRRLVNLLSTARLYLDQVKHDLSTLYGSNSEALASFENWASQEYDSRLGYRVMEALRNLVQHRTLPLSGLYTHFERRDAQQQAVMVTTVRPELDLDGLRRDGALRAALVAELDAQGERLRLKILVRDYIAGIAVVHENLRTSLDAEVAPIQATFTEVIARCTQALGVQPLFVRVMARGDHGELGESHDIFDELIKRRSRLASRTGRARYVVTQVASTD